MRKGRTLLHLLPLRQPEKYERFLGVWAASGDNKHVRLKKSTSRGRRVVEVVGHGDGDAAILQTGCVAFEKARDPGALHDHGKASGEERVFEGNGSSGRRRCAKREASAEPILEAKSEPMSTRRYIQPRS